MGRPKAELPTDDQASVVLSVTTTAGAVRWLDERAEAEGIDRSELVRRMLRFARKEMPAPRTARPAPKPTAKKGS